MTEGEFAPFIEGLIRAEEHDRKLLKPCPFCGEEVSIKVNARGEAVYVCSGCNAMITWKNDLLPNRKDHKEWNRRVSE